MRTSFMLALLVLAACSAKLSGDLSIDGKPFKPSACRSGQVYGFTGVELSAEDGTRLRIAAQPSGAAGVFIMPAGVAKGIELADCGTITVTPQSSTINDVKNVEGSITLSCELEGHSVKGVFTFSNCH